MGFLKATTAALSLLSVVAAASACGVLFDQCGGEGFMGATCCTTGLQCMTMGKFYSQCRPMPPSPGQVTPYAQCGGAGYTGPTECTPGFKCTVLDASFSNCDVISKRAPVKPVLSPTEPAPPGKVCGKEYQACGGKGFKGARCCKFGLQCVLLSEYNSQCLAPEPEEGELGRYAQCGGLGFTGTSTKCVGGYRCMEVAGSEGYKQCSPLHP